MPAEPMIHCESLARRLNEPPEPSPGLSEAMPWVAIPHCTLRPEGARESSTAFRHGDDAIRTNVESRGLLRPFRALGYFMSHAQGIVLAHSALGCILKAFQAFLFAPFQAASLTLEPCRNHSPKSTST